MAIQKERSLGLVWDVRQEKVKCCPEPVLNYLILDFGVAKADMLPSVVDHRGP